MALGTFALGFGVVLLAPSATILYYSRFAQRGRVVLEPQWLEKPLAGMVVLGILLILAGVFVFSLRSRSRYGRRSNSDPAEPSVSNRTLAAMERFDRAQREDQKF